MDLPGCVMDDWWTHHGVSILEVRYLRGCGSTWGCDDDCWNHNGVTSYCDLLIQQVRYSRGGVFARVWYGWLNHHGANTYGELSNQGVMCLHPKGGVYSRVCDGWLVDTREVGLFTDGVRHLRGMVFGDGI